MIKQYKYLVFLVTIVILLIPGTAMAKELHDDRVVAGGTFTLDSGEILDGSLTLLFPFPMFNPNLSRVGIFSLSSQLQIMFADAILSTSQPSIAIMLKSIISYLFSLLLITS